MGWMLTGCLSIQKKKIYALNSIAFTCSPQYMQIYAHYCRSGKNPRERRFELRNLLFLQCVTSSILTFHEGATLGLDKNINLNRWRDLRGRQSKPCRTHPKRQETTLDD
jgi:hypothetical protein